MSRARRGRGALMLAVVLSMMGVALPAWAGSYLDRAAMMLDEARREGDLLQPRIMDKELVLVVRALAEARAKVASKMEIPIATAKVHPHLLLVLEHYERAADAASEGNFKSFMEHLAAARDEEKTFRALVSELGFTLRDSCAKQ